MITLCNPPFTGNLHLKILQEALKHCSTVVNLSPVRWLQDPLAEYKNSTDYKKFESIRKHLKSVEILESIDANALFTTRLNTDLAIYVTSKNGGFDSQKFLKNSIIDKVMGSNLPYIYDFVDTDRQDGWRVRVSDIKPLNAGSSGKRGTSGWYNRYILLHPRNSWVYFNGTQNSHHWTFFSGKTGSKVYTENDVLPLSIKFTSELGANNFEKSTKTLFFEYVYSRCKLDQHTPWKVLPFMAEAVNPRTGLLGYKGPWTDEDFFNFFELNEEERNIVLNTMEKYNK